VAETGARGNPLALVADDEPLVRGVLARIVHREGFDVLEAEDGQEAARLAIERRPAVVLLDLLMPKRDGFWALKEIRAHAHDVPVVVISAVDDPREAERALDLGAANFVSKPFDTAEIHQVLERVRAAHAEEVDVLPCVRVLGKTRTVLEVGNDLGLLSRVVAFLGHELRIHYPGRDLPFVETKLALYEALANAIEHGNLGIDYDAKTEALATAEGITALIERRRHEAPWRDRVARLTAEYGPTSVRYAIRDGGPGFSRATVEGSKSLGDVHSLHGRGLLLIKHYMSRVSWNPEGNEIRMELDLVPREAEASRPGPTT
jgi:DNA-binding response OmpR family regulator